MCPQSQPTPARSIYLSADTIVALASSTGGAISVLRISGPQSICALIRLVPGFEPVARQMTRVSLSAPDGKKLDDAMACCFFSPASFTGEEVVELYLHGSAVVAARVLEELLRGGVRQAQPGEFSFRAVRNGKMSLLQAQAVADLISAGSEAAADLALEKMEGLQNRAVQEISEGLKQLVALSELGIDFSDQDIEEVGLPALKGKLALLETKLTRMSESFQRGTLIQEGVRVALVGLPNAGKSSFFNALLGEDRSIVSEIAGTTRDLVRERLTLRGAKTSVLLRLEDTAGLRKTADHVENLGIERSRKAAAAADLVLLIADAKDLETNEGRERLRSEWSSLNSPVGKTLAILTKVDLLAAADLEKSRDFLKSLGIRRCVSTSAREGLGISEAAREIADFCEVWVHREEKELLLTRLDHKRALEAAGAHLERAESGTEAELFAADLRQALVALEPLIGETVPDDILDRIFSQFCIGK